VENNPKYVWKVPKFYGLFHSCDIMFRHLLSHLIWKQLQSIQYLW